MRLTGCLLVILLAFHLRPAAGVAAPNPEFVGEPPARVAIDAHGSEAAQAVRYVLTELKRLSNRYRYIRLISCHSATKGAASFSGSNTFLDLELDMLRNQRSRHDVIVFHDKDGSIMGMAIDEFPEVRLRELPDPDV
jgi:hypothetical protein